MPLHSRVAEALEQIDAAFFSGDTFHDAGNRAIVAEYLERWNTAVLELSHEDANEMQGKSQECCPDCGVYVGDKHKPNCDVERCPACGGQALMCLVDEDGVMRCHNTNTVVAEDELMPWTGKWPGESECEEYGFWCKMVKGKGWVTCAKDDPEVVADMNRLYTECRWDRSKHRMVKVE